MELVCGLSVEMFTVEVDFVHPEVREYVMDRLHLRIWTRGTGSWPKQKWRG